MPYSPSTPQNYNPARQRRESDPTGPLLRRSPSTSFPTSAIFPTCTSSVSLTRPTASSTPGVVTQLWKTLAPAYSKSDEVAICWFRRSTSSMVSKPILLLVDKKVGFIFKKCCRKCEILECSYLHSSPSIWCAWESTVSTKSSRYSVNLAYLVFLNQKMQPYHSTAATQSGTWL